MTTSIPTNAAAAVPPTPTTDADQGNAPAAGPKTVKITKTRIKQVVDAITKSRDEATKAKDLVNQMTEGKAGLFANAVREAAATAFEGHDVDGAIVKFDAIADELANT